MKQSVIYKISTKIDSTRKYLENITTVNCPGNECFYCLTPQGLLFLGHTTLGSATLSIKRIPTDPSKPADLEKSFPAPNFRIPKKLFCKAVYDRDEKYSQDRAEVFIYYGAGNNYLLSIDLLQTQEVKSQKFYVPPHESVNFELKPNDVIDWNSNFVVKNAVDEIRFVHRYWNIHKGKIVNDSAVQKGFWIWIRNSDKITPILEKYFPIDYNFFYLKGNTIHAPTNLAATTSSDFILERNPRNTLKINDVDMLTEILDKTQITIYYDDNTKGRIMLSEIFYHSKFWRNFIIFISAILLIVLYFTISKKVKAVKRERRRRKLLAVKSYGSQDDGTFASIAESSDEYHRIDRQALSEDTTS